MVHVPCLLGLTFSYAYCITAKLSQTLAPAHGAPFDVPFDDDRRAVFAGDRAAAAPARRLFESSDLAASEGPVAFLAELVKEPPKRESLTSSSDCIGMLS